MVSSGGGGGGGGGAGPGGFGQVGGGRSGGFDRGGGRDMEVQEDTIFVSGLGEDITEGELAEFFGAIGIVKVIMIVLPAKFLKCDVGVLQCLSVSQVDKRTGKHKVWIYKDKMTGKPKGEATVTYDDPPAAMQAINWFNGENTWLLNGGGNLLEIRINFDVLVYRKRFQW